MMRVIFKAAALALSFAALLPVARGSDAYPSKSIHIVIGYAPGGSADIVGRVLAQELSTSMGKPVIVENKPGANALIATKEVLKASPDGHTVLLTSLSHVVNPILNPKLADYDPINSFAPVSLIATLPLVVVTADSAPFSSIKDLTQKARSSPGSVTYGSAGNGGSGHLAGAMLALSAEVEMTHIPFKGNAPALTEVMAGRVSYTFFPMVGIAEHVQQKRLKVLATATKERMPQFAGVPTMAEAGFQGFEETAIWLGLMAPAGTPPNITDRLYKEISKALSLPHVRKRLEGLGAIPAGTSPQDFSNYLNSDLDRWARVIKASGIRTD